MPAIPTWYQALNKPFFNPPNFVFGPVWTILYLLMAIAFYIVWNSKTKKKAEKERAIHLFLIQLALNFSWSIVFFNLHQLLFSFGVITALWLSILFTIHAFYRISKPAAYLLIPYILWVSFASILNLFIVLLN